jgi:hypothetical protein
LLVVSDIEPMNDDQARAVGVLAGHAGATDVVNATVVEGALRRHDIVISSDPDDLEAIAHSVNRRRVVCLIRSVARQRSLLDVAAQREAVVPRGVRRGSDTTRAAVVPT